jgi:hypothetical protein
MGKRIELKELKARREAMEQAVLRTRATLEQHAAELEKVRTPENRRMLSAEGLRTQEEKVTAKTRAALVRQRATLIEELDDSFDYRTAWTREATLKNARFAPGSPNRPGTEDAKTHAVLNGILEQLARQNASQFAARLTDEDLIAEAEAAAVAGDLPTVALYRQESRLRKFDALKQLHFNAAVDKLQLPDVQEAEQVYGDLEALVDESDALLALWENPRSESAAGKEAFHRFNRKRRAEQIIANELAKDEQKAKAAEGVKLIETPASVFVPVPPEQSSAA